MNLGSVLSSVAPAVTAPFLEKYRADLQGHQLDRQNEFNRNESLAAFERNKAWELEKFNLEKANSLEMWNRQNEYNSPAAQMGRMKAAGLNPNLMYGQGTTGNAAVINTPAVDNTEYQPVRSDHVDRQIVDPVGDAMLGLSRYFQIRNSGMELQNKASINSLLKQRIRGERARADMLEVDADIFKKAGVSTRDPWWLRMGGRVTDFLERVSGLANWKRIEELDGFIPLDEFEKKRK